MTKLEAASKFEDYNKLAIRRFIEDFFTSIDPIKKPKIVKSKKVSITV